MQDARKHRRPHHDQSVVVEPRFENLTKLMARLNKELKEADCLLAEAQSSTDHKMVHRCTVRNTPYRTFRRP
jgi:hypothetical protein